MPYRGMEMGEVTRLLHAVSEGSSEAFDRLLPVVYDSLKQIARAHLRGRGNNKTISTTDLVHDTYLKMSAQSGMEWEGRSHFFAVASRAMRQILVDYARRKNAVKRGNPHGRITLTSRKNSYELNLAEILTLDQALDALQQLNDRLRKVVEYRFFGGMNEEEIAEVLGISTRTVERDWMKARMFLHRELYPDESPPG
jgi:RNA polymerase sigma factor (TIGR02999 family)